MFVPENLVVPCTEENLELTEKYEKIENEIMDLLKSHNLNANDAFLVLSAVRCQIESKLIKMLV